MAETKTMEKATEVAAEQTTEKSVMVAVGVFGSAEKRKEVLESLKAKKFEGAKLVKKGRFTYVVAGECKKSEAAELIKKVRAAGLHAAYEVEA